jgi:hypothetical protein
MKINIEKIITKNTDADGNIDFGKVTQAVVGQVETHTDRAVSTAKDEAVSAFVKELKIDGVTNAKGLETHLANHNVATDEIKTKNTKLENDLAEANKYKAKYEELSTKQNVTSQAEKLKELGIKPEHMDSAMTLINAKVNDTTSFEAASKAFIESDANA